MNTSLLCFGAILLIVLLFQQNLSVSIQGIRISQPKMNAESIFDIQFVSCKFEPYIRCSNRKGL